MTGGGGGAARRGGSLGSSGTGRIAGPGGAGPDARRLHRRRGSLATDPFALALSQAEAGWSWSSLRVLDLHAGGSAALETGEDEVLVLPLAGSCTVRSPGAAFELAGRASPFAGVSDACYLPPATELRVESPGGGRFAVPGARAEGRHAARYIAPGEVPVELRGAGPSSRWIAKPCFPETFAAERLIVCEVVTPGGNWSSYPPHKHDEAREDESELEEVYYFEVQQAAAAARPSGAAGAGAAPGAAGRPAARPVAYQRVYGTPERPIDVLVEVATGDVVLVPHGWHGPSMAPPGYDLYYLNVMAGPGRRAWLARDDPAHAWVRESWSGQDLDRRLGPGGLVAGAAGRPDAGQAGGDEAGPAGIVPAQGSGDAH